MDEDQYFKELHVMNIHEEMMPRNVNDSTRKRELWPNLGGTGILRWRFHLYLKISGWFNFETQHFFFENHLPPGGNK